MPQSVFILKDSKISGVGLWPGTGDWGSLWIQTANILMENNIIHDSPGGIALDLATGARIIDNTVLQCLFCLTLERAGSGNTISGNTISQCIFSALTSEALEKSKISDNRISQAWEISMSIISSHGDNQILKNNISHAGMAYFSRVITVCS
jgi:parallel beta-helix repeat protein